MLKYLQLPYYYDNIRMLEEIKCMDPGFWQLHYQKAHYDGNWSVLPLRSVGGKSDSIIISPIDKDEYNDTPFLADSPYLNEILATFKCPLLAVRLMKLNAGAIIKKHIDADLNFEKGEIRLHIPVITHPNVEFYLDDEQIVMREGQCWYLNLNLPHHVNNRSQLNRIHLVIDARVNDWVKDLFNDSHIKIKKSIPDPGYDDITKKEMIIHLRLMNTTASNKMADGLQDELV